MSWVGDFVSLRITTCTWDEVPHLSEEVKKDLWEHTPPFLRDARAKGLPLVGAGLIYPLPEEEIRVADFKIPDDFPRGLGLDVGWRKTAAGWFAQNPQSKVVYLHDYHYQGRTEPAIHAAAIKARGAWIPGVIDPRSDGRSVIDGKAIFDMYTKPESEGGYGLDLVKANNSISAGIASVWQMFSGGMLKVFESVVPFWKEYRMYRTDENGEVVQKDDDFLDMVRYFVMSGIVRMKTATMGARSGRHPLVDFMLQPHDSRRGLTWMSG